MTSMVEKKEVQRDLLLRLRRIEGQVRGVQRMIEEEAECSEIMTQIAAIKSAMNKVGILVFENHAQDCILQAFEEGREDEKFKELIAIMERLVK